MVDKHPKRSDEPVWWGLFGAGGTWFAMISPVTILVLGILAPLGIIDAEVMSYEKVAVFVKSFIGVLFTIATIALPMWHAMHRVHHGMHDLKLHTGTAGKVICYATAGFMTALTITFIYLV